MATAAMRKKRSKQRAGAGTMAIYRDFRNMDKKGGRKTSAKALQKLTVGSRNGRGFNTRGASKAAGSDS